MAAAINTQVGNEFGASLQYVAIGAYFGSEKLPELSAHFHKQAAEERDHAMRLVNYAWSRPAPGRKSSHPSSKVRIQDRRGSRGTLLELGADRHKADQ